MLQAKTEEQKTYIEDVILKDTSTWFGDDVCDGIHIDDFITFDEMAAIVDYIRHCNATERKEYVSECTEDWNYRENKNGV